MRWSRAMTFAFRAHDLRRTAATRMAEAGVLRDHIARILNHIQDGPAATRVYDRFAQGASASCRPLAPSVAPNARRPSKFRVPMARWGDTGERCRGQDRRGSDPGSVMGRRAQRRPHRGRSPFAGLVAIRRA